MGKTISVFVGFVFGGIIALLCYSFLGIGYNIFLFLIFIFSYLAGFIAFEVGSHYYDMKQEGKEEKK